MMVLMNINILTNCHFTQGVEGIIPVAGSVYHSVVGVHKSNAIFIFIITAVIWFPIMPINVHWWAFCSLIEVLPFFFSLSIVLTSPKETTVTSENHRKRKNTQKLNLRCDKVFFVPVHDRWTGQNRTSFLTTRRCCWAIHKGSEQDAIASCD